jgi:hypothetical protein
MCKIPHFSHFNEIYSPLDVPLTPSGGLSCLCLTVVVLATPKEMFFANHLSPITISAMVYCKKNSLLSKQASLVIVIGFIRL